MNMFQSIFKQTNKNRYSIYIVILFIFTLLVGFNMVLRHKINNLNAEIQNQRELIAWMIESKEILSSNTVNSKIKNTIGNEDLVYSIESIFKKLKFNMKDITINRISAEKVSLSFARIDFLVFMELILVVQQMGIDVEMLNASKLEVPGIVNANVVLKK